MAVERVKSAKSTKATGEAVSYPVVNASGAEVGSVSLLGELFQAPVKESLVFDTVLWQLSKRRQGTHSCLTKGTMKGGGKKPWKQKGTGRARAGTSCSPLWVGGGVAHGPKSNPFGYRNRLSKRSRRQGLSAVLSDLCASKSLVIIESLPVSKGTTKEFIKLLKDCGLAGKKVGLLCGANSDPKQVRAARNVTGVSIFSAAGVNPWELLKVDAVLGEKAVFDSLQQELVGRVSEVSARRNRRAVPGVANS